MAAGPTISCHCFKDRSFDAAKPAAADPYLLATTQSSLAAVFGLDKKELLRARMTGNLGGRATWGQMLEGTGGTASLIENDISRFVEGSGRETR